MKRLDVNWLYPLKRKLIIGILGILTLSITATTLISYFALRDGLTRNRGSAPASSAAWSKQALPTS